VVAGSNPAVCPNRKDLAMPHNHLIDLCFAIMAICSLAQTAMQAIHFFDDERDKNGFDGRV
jgi:hypothetical protein